MPTIRDDAIILGRVDYSETSQVLVLFTRENGKVRAIAKGIKRGTKTRFATGLDLLDVGQVVVNNRQERSATLANLTEWKQTRSLSGLRESLSRLYAAQYAAEVTSNLTEDWDPHTELFDAMTENLICLAESSNPLESVVRYQLALLHAIGAMPRFDVCTFCGRDDDLTHFSSFEGGLVCTHCEAGQVEKRELSAATLANLRGEDAPEALTGAFTVLNYHIAHLMGREPALAAQLVPLEVQRRIE